MPTTITEEHNFLAVSLSVSLLRVYSVSFSIQGNFLDVISRKLSLPSPVLEIVHAVAPFRG